MPEGFPGHRVGVDAATTSSTTRLPRPRLAHLPTTPAHLRIPLPLLAVFGGVRFPWGFSSVAECQGARPKGLGFRCDGARVTRIVARPLARAAAFARRRVRERVDDRVPRVSHRPPASPRPRLRPRAPSLARVVPAPIPPHPASRFDVQALVASRSGSLTFPHPSSLNVQVGNFGAKRGELQVRAARVAGVEIPNNKRAETALTYVYGIGNTTAKKIMSETGLENKRIREFEEEELTTLRNEVDKYLIEGDLRRFNMMNIKRLKEIQCYRGRRHIHNLPMRGQRTKTNARTRKGKVKTVAGKKK